jgi:hypothetical protein
MGAFEAAAVTAPPVSGKVVDVKNAKVARIQEFSHSALAGVTITGSKLRFNQDCISFFEDTGYVELLFHPTERLLAVRKTTGGNKNAVFWNAKSIGAARLCKTFYTFCGWEPKIGYKVMADFFVRGEERLLMFDLGNAEYFIKQELESRVSGESGEDVSVIKAVVNFFDPESWDDFGKDCPAHATAGRRWLAHSLQNWQIDAPAENVSGFDICEDTMTDKEVLFNCEEEMSRRFGALLEANNPKTSEVIEHA